MEEYLKKEKKKITSAIYVRLSQRSRRRRED